MCVKVEKIHPIMGVRFSSLTTGGTHQLVGGRKHTSVIGCTSSSKQGAEKYTWHILDHATWKEHKVCDDIFAYYAFLFLS